jgi:Fe-S oxidoreductase
MGNFEFEMVHISDYIKQLMDEGVLKIGGSKKKGPKFSYHDSCRLGRHSGVYDSPRELAKAFPGAEFVEMQNTKDKAVCCGVSAWINCNANTKKAQIERVMEAKKVGADSLLMFCPKCQIHLRCAVQDKVPVDPKLVDVRLEDFTVAMARMLNLMPAGEESSK